MDKEQKKHELIQAKARITVEYKLGRIEAYQRTSLAVMEVILRNAKTATENGQVGRSIFLQEVLLPQLNSAIVDGPQQEEGSDQ